MAIVVNFTGMSTKPPGGSGGMKLKVLHQMWMRKIITKLISEYYFRPREDKWKK